MMGMNTDWPLSQPRIRMAPSLLSADFARLKDEIQRIEAAGAEILHLDVMDGHFVPNISFGVPVIEKLRPISKLFFDTHLMIADPVKYAEPFVKAGSDLLTFHIEVTETPAAVAEHIRNCLQRMTLVKHPGGEAVPEEMCAPARGSNIRSPNAAFHNSRKGVCMR